MPPRQVRLSDEIRDIPPNLAEYIARKETRMREDLSTKISGAFASSNVVVLVVLLILIGIDFYFLFRLGAVYAPYRVVDRGVLKTLIGATTVQLGLLMAPMVGYLFPRRSKP